MKKQLTEKSIFKISGLSKDKIDFNNDSSYLEFGNFELKLTDITYIYQRLEFNLLKEGNIYFEKINNKYYLTLKATDNRHISFEINVYYSSVYKPFSLKLIRNNIIIWKHETSMSHTTETKLLTFDSIDEDRIYFNNSDLYLTLVNCYFHEDMYEWNTTQRELKDKQFTIFNSENIRLIKEADTLFLELTDAENNKYKLRLTHTEDEDFVKIVLYKRGSTRSNKLSEINLPIPKDDLFEVKDINLVHIKFSNDSNLLLKNNLFVYEQLEEMKKRLLGKKFKFFDLTNLKTHESFEGYLYLHLIDIEGENYLIELEENKKNIDVLFLVNQKEQEKEFRLNIEDDIEIKEENVGKEKEVVDIDLDYIIENSLENIVKQVYANKFTAIPFFQLKNENEILKEIIGTIATQLSIIEKKENKDLEIMKIKNYLEVLNKLIKTTK